MFAMGAEQTSWCTADKYVAAESGVHAERVFEKPRKTVLGFIRRPASFLYALQSPMSMNGLGRVLDLSDAS